MITSAEMKKDGRKLLYLQFRIDQKLLAAIEAVHTAEQDAVMMPLHRSNVLVKLLWLGVQERKRTLGKGVSK